MTLTDRHRRYWRKNQILTAILLAIWFVGSFVLTYFARALSFTFFGWSFSFWLAAQGALIVYVLIVAVYAWRMNRLDQEYGFAEAD